MIESSSSNNKKSRRTRPLRTDFFLVGSRNLSTIMGQFKCITVKTNSLNIPCLPQHSSCWLERHQFFIKYRITEGETFKGEGKIEFAVSARALMIMAFHKVISGLGDWKRQASLGRAQD